MRIFFRYLIVILLFLSPSLRHPLLAQSDPAPQQVDITVNTRDVGTPFPHFWEQLFGSGRATLSLRQSYRDDLHTVKQVTNFQAVRFHGIFMDDVGLFDLDANGKPVYNFS